MLERCLLAEPQEISEIDRAPQRMEKNTTLQILQAAKEGGYGVLAAIA
jgi:hypothetical protein